MNCFSRDENSKFKRKYTCFFQWFFKVFKNSKYFFVKKEKDLNIFFNDYHFANVIDIKTFVLPTLLYHNIQYKNTHRKLFTTQKSNALQKMMSV